VRFQQYFAVKSHYRFTTESEMKYSLLHNTAVTKQWTEKWPYNANVIFRYVAYKIMVKKVTLDGFRRGAIAPLDLALPTFK